MIAFGHEERTFFSTQFIPIFDMKASEHSHYWIKRIMLHLFPFIIIILDPFLLLILFFIGLSTLTINTLTPSTLSFGRLP
jgi:hypothetical protein